MRLGEHYARLSLAYSKYQQTQQAKQNAFAEFGVDTEDEPFHFETLTIWREHLKILDLFDYAVFKFNDYTGQVMGVDWQAVDVLLNREEVEVTAQQFKDWRIALNGYVNVLNEQTNQ